jgi:AAA+ ATPase superfamily predicted ATPase
MNYALVGSPDKLMLSSFIRYFIKTLDGGHVFGDLHYLMSEEAKELFIEDFCSKNPKGIFSYYIKKPVQGNLDPLVVLPKKASSISEVILWFDLYATEPILIKDSKGIMAPIIEQWKLYIAKLGG